MSTYFERLLGSAMRKAREERIAGETTMVNKVIRSPKSVTKEDAGLIKHLRNEEENEKRLSSRTRLRTVGGVGLTGALGAYTLKKHEDKRKKADFENLNQIIRR